MGNKIPMFLTIAILSVMMEDELGIKPKNIEYLKMWQELENQWKLHTNDPTQAQT